MTEHDFGGHPALDNQTCPAAEGRAIAHTQSEAEAPGHSFARQEDSVNRVVAARDGGGQTVVDAQRRSAAPDPIPFAGHPGIDAHAGYAGEGEAPCFASTIKALPPPPHSAGQTRVDAHSSCASGSDDGGHNVCDIQDGPAPVIAEIIEQAARRRAWHRAEKSLTLQTKALCRRLVGGDKKEADRLFAAVDKGKEHDLSAVASLAIGPLLSARKVLSDNRNLVEKRLVKLTDELSARDFVDATRGFGRLGFALLVGEAGDIGSYKSVAALWKRMGLAVIGGERQRRVSGAAALEHGYAPERRSLMWNIGDCIIKARGDLRAVYDERKAYEAERVETKGHAHNRAKRYMEKRLLRELWKAWRAAIVPALPEDGAPPAITYLEAAE